MLTTSCLFCQIVAGQSPSKKVWENEQFLAIENKYPKAPIHLLLLAKKHESKTKLVAEGGKERFWGRFMEAVMEVVRQKGLNKTGYKLVNNGAGYNHFDHEHMHILGGSKSEPGGET